VRVRGIQLLLCLFAGLMLAGLTFTQVAESGSTARQSSLPTGPSVVITAPVLDVTGMLDLLRDPKRSPFPDQLLLVVLVFAVLSPKIGGRFLSEAASLRMAPVGRQTPIRLRGPPPAV
jgi:hypothetical protein